MKKVILRSSHVAAPYFQFGLFILWMALTLVSGGPLWFCVLVIALGTISALLLLPVIYWRDFAPHERLCYQLCPRCKTFTFMRVIGHTWGRCPKCQKKYWLEDR